MVIFKKFQVQNSCPAVATIFNVEINTKKC